MDVLAGHDVQKLGPHHPVLAARDAEPRSVIRVNDGRPSFGLVAKDHKVTLDPRGRTLFLSIGLITTIGPASSRGRRRPRKPGDRERMHRAALFLP